MSINVERNQIVYITQDYDQFVYLKGNRPISQAKVRRIRKNMILHGNLLEMYPIVVSSIRKGKHRGKLEIHDGQHRFEAARMLNEPVAYILDEKERLTLATLRATAGTQTGWALRDFLHSYCELGEAEYLRVKEYFDHYPMPVAVGLQLLAGGRRSHWSADFKSGTSRIKDILYFFPQARSGQFIRAFTFICRNAHYDHEEFMRKLKMNPASLQVEATADAYFDKMEAIYNWKRHNRNLVVFHQIDSEGRVYRAGRWVAQDLVEKKEEEAA